MRTLWTCAVVGSLFVVIASCKKQDDTQQPNAAATATGYPGYPGYPPPQGGQYPPPPGGAYGQYPTAPAPTYGQYPQPQPMPTAPVPAPGPTAAPTGSGQMAIPGPVAFQCQNDVPCGTHHCNLQYGKCAFPCQSNVDCLTPNQCIMGLCVPAPPQTH